MSFSFSGAVYRAGRCAGCGSVGILRRRRPVRSRSHRAATGPRRHDPRPCSEGRESDRATRRRLEAASETVHTPPHLHRCKNIVISHHHHHHLIIITIITVKQLDDVVVVVVVRKAYTRRHNYRVTSAPPSRLPLRKQKCLQ